MKPLKSKTAARLFAFATSPTIVVYVISLCVLCGTLALTYHHRSFVSDDVTWQSIIHNWRPFSGEKVTLGATDNFVDKLPFFEIMEHIFPAGRKLLFLEAAMLAIIGFTAFYMSVIYFSKRVRKKLTYVNLLPVVWLASFGYSYSQLLLNPIWRGFELGLAMGLFAIMAAVFADDIKPWATFKAKIGTLLVVLAAGVIFYSDPYFLYFTALPVIVFTGLLLALGKISARHVYLIAGAFIGSMLVAKVSAIIAANSGITMATAFPTVFISFDRLPSNILGGLHGVFIIFGADFFGNKLARLPTLSALANAGLLMAGLILSYFFAKIDTVSNNQNKSLAVWYVFFVALVPFVFLVSVLSSFTNASTYRYYAILAYTFVLLLVLLIPQTSKWLRRSFVGLLALSTLLNIIVSLMGDPGYLQPGNVGNIRNSTNYQIIHEAQSRKISKGYGNYWQGPINTYLSRNSVHVLPAACGSNGKTVKFRWLIDNKSFELPANKSFMIIDPDLADPPACSVEQLTVQFGAPNGTIFVGNKTILFYNYDIGIRM